jgi:hypothetical protein
MVLVMVSIPNWTELISGTTVKQQALQDGPIVTGFIINCTTRTILDLAQILDVKKAAL